MAAPTANAQAGRDAATRAISNPEPRFGDERLPPRFWAKVEISPGGCWLWSGSLGQQSGYGRYLLDGRRIINGVRRTNRGSRDAHRIAYLALVGPVHAGLTLDHLCRTRSCVNPAHLEPVSNRENVLRGVGPSAVNAAKTQCNRGHELTGDNVNIRIGRNGREQRECRACVLVRSRARSGRSRT